jgi:hypothetical protein
MDENILNVSLKIPSDLLKIIGNAGGRDFDLITDFINSNVPFIKSIVNFKVEQGFMGIYDYTVHCCYTVYSEIEVFISHLIDYQL